MGIKTDGVTSDAARAVRIIRLVRVVSVLELMGWQYKQVGAGRRLLSLVLVRAECGLELTAWWCLHNSWEKMLQWSLHIMQGRTLQVKRCQFYPRTRRHFCLAPPTLCSGGRSATAGMTPPLIRRTNLRPQISAAKLEASAQLAAVTAEVTLHR